jgi:hypothetical protein
MRGVGFVLALCLFVLTLLAGTTAGAQERVYITEDEVLADALAGADSVVQRTVRLEPEMAGELANELRMPILDSTYVFHEARVGGRPTRRVVVINALGQYQPITFAVTLGTGQRVERVEIMVYRESRGAEVRRGAFLKQFVGKAGDDRLEVGAGIRHISGATVSSRAVAGGVRLALRLQELLGDDG